MMKNSYATVKNLALLTTLLSSCSIWAAEPSKVQHVIEASELTTATTLVLQTHTVKPEILTPAQAAERFIAELQQDVKKGIELQVRDGLLSVIQVIKNTL